MPTISDPEVYKTLGTKVVKTVTVPGQTGKQIKVESWSASIANATKGVKTTLTTYMKYSGKKTAVAGWGTTEKDYAPMSYNKFAYTADAGVDVILQWELKTDSTASAAMMKDASVTYSYVDVEGNSEAETPTEEKDEFIIVKCKASETSGLITKIKGIAPTVEINTLSQVG